MAFQNSPDLTKIPRTNHVWIPVTNPSAKRGYFIKYGFKMFNPKPFTANPLSNPPLVMINGWTATKEDFYDLPLALLSKSNLKRTIIAVDHRGMGESVLFYNNDVNSHERTSHARANNISKPVPQFTLADLADDLAYLISHLFNKYSSIDVSSVGSVGSSTNSNRKTTLTQNVFESMPQIDLLGVSMGGMVAQLFAVRYPQYTRRLVLCATALGGGVHTPKRGAKNKEFFELSTSLSSVKSKEELLERVKKLMLLNLGSDLESQDYEFVDHMVRVSQATRRPAQTIMGQANAIFAFNNAKNAAKIGKDGLYRFPTMIMHGGEDNVLDVANGKIIADTIANNVFIEMRNEGHLHYGTRKGLVMSAHCIDQFLNLNVSQTRLDLTPLWQKFGKDNVSATYSALFAVADPVQSGLRSKL